MGSINNSIILISPYFGVWPIWFDAHLKSIESNCTIDWLIPTDCKIPDEYPQNIRFIETSLYGINKDINKQFKIEISLSPRKFCDLKPAYGKIFQEYISGYDFWGFTDLDIIWGKIRKFISEDMLNNNDIISSKQNNLAGHFTLIRNTESLNNLYKKIPSYGEKLLKSAFQWSDEFHFNNIIKHQIEKKHNKHNIYWKKNLLNVENGIDSHQEYHLDRWQWNNGEIINTDTEEDIMYLHFINWKVTMVKNEVMYEQPVDSFFISYNGIHFNKHSRLQILINRLKNIIFGYWIGEWKRKQENKIVSYIKKVQSFSLSDYETN